jgi:hypothetical protein
VLPSFLRGAFESFSDHVVYTSSLYGDLRSRVTQMEGGMIDFTREPRTDADGRCAEAARLLRPYQTDTTLVRVGDRGDGGYVMAEDLSAVAAISIVIGENASWDIDIAGRGLPVAMFDPTIPGPPSFVTNSTFHRVGLGTSEQAVATGLALEPLPRLLELARVPAIGDLILKIDVEGAEWDALADVNDFSRYPQIVLEIHELARLGEASSAASVLHLLRALHATHLPIHLHANNEAGLAGFGAYWLPDVVEVSYMRRDLARNARPAGTLDTHLDSPSNARFTDLALDGLLTVAPLPEN